MPTIQVQYKVIQVMITTTLYKCFVLTTKSKGIYTEVYTRCSRKIWKLVSQKKKGTALEELELVGLLTEVLLVLSGWIHFVPGLGI